jgi:hypothetical protein
MGGNRGFIPFHFLIDSERFLQPALCRFRTNILLVRPHNAAKSSSRGPEICRALKLGENVLIDIRRIFRKTVLSDTQPNGSPPRPRGIFPVVQAEPVLRAAKREPAIEPDECATAHAEGPRFRTLPWKAAVGKRRCPEGRPRHGKVGKGIAGRVKGVGGQGKGARGCPREARATRAHPIRGARESFLAITEAVKPLIAGISTAAGRRPECPEILAAPGRSRGGKHGTHRMSLTPWGSLLSGPLIRGWGPGNDGLSEWRGGNIMRKGLC